MTFATEATSPPPPQQPSRAAGLIRRALETGGAQCEVRLASGETIRLGEGDPQFRLVFHSDRVLAKAFDELALGEAYVNGEFDIEGDMLALLELRENLGRRLRFLQWVRFWFGHLFFRPRTLNQRAGEVHYELGYDFFGNYLETRHRMYTHALFSTEEESLEDATENKLASIFEKLQLKPGMRLLDIGAGWGCMEEYCGTRGVEVTALTMSEPSRQFVEELICDKNLSATVEIQDILTYRPEKPFDAAVMLGVIEHLPHYKPLVRKIWECLKPGAPYYLDGASTLEKYSNSPFVRKYVWDGNHSFMCMPELAQEFLFHGFQVNEVQQETRDYGITMRHWAQRLDEAREQIVRNWGEKIYRTFRIYLWAGCHAFKTDGLQAYHLLVTRGDGPGMRPGWWYRTRNFFRDLR